MIEEKFITYQREPFFEIASNYINSESKVLDVGSGDGSFPRFCKRSDFHLLEGNEETVSFLKKEFPNVTLGRIPEIPFEDNFFDTIHCSHIVEHLEPSDLYKLLKEINRTLKKGGYFIVSTPMLWTGFYNDMSHIKPYNPYVFEKYLCNISAGNLTRRKISSEFEIKELKYRYSSNYSRFNLTNQRPKNLLNRMLMSIFFRLRKNGLIFLEKTGYTLVLRKNG